MTTPPVAPKTLEERITARLHESLGDLITDADLKGIVERGIEKALFQERSKQSDRGYYDHTTIKLPPLVDELVANLLTERMTASVEAWLKAHPAELDQAVAAAIAKGAGAAMLQTLDSRFAVIFTQGVQMLQNQGLLPRGPNG